MTAKDRIADFTNEFDRLLEHVPHEMRGPLVDVLDTAYAVSIWMKAHNVKDAAALIGLTELVLRERTRTKRKARSR